jgi:hypothetical protein
MCINTIVLSTGNKFRYSVAQLDAETDLDCDADVDKYFAESALEIIYFNAWILEKIALYPRLNFYRYQATLNSDYWNYKAKRPNCADGMKVS